MDAQNTSQNGLAGAISSAIAPVLSQAQTSLVEDVNDTFGGEGGAAAPVAAPATPSTPAAPSLSTPQPSVQPGFQPAMPIVPSRGGLGNSQVLMKLLENQRQMREQMDTMNRIDQSPFQPSNVPGIFRGLGPGVNNFGGTLAEPQAGPQYPAQLLAEGGKTEARAVQNQGRGDDTMLVHMTPGEVKGLQQLAMAYGGSLTINPKTGLPEAGFLKSLLPTLIGAGLVIGTGGAVTPLMAGFGVGAVETLRTGDLGRGLMAGLGAYGGGGLGSAASAAGAASAKEAALVAGDNAFIAGGDAAAGLSYVPPETIGGQFAQAGSGVSNLFSSGAAGDAARKAAMGGFTDAATGTKFVGLGSPTAATMKTVGAVAEPLSQPAPMPDIPQVESNYEGPYTPTKREVVYPGADRDPADSSEFLYFRNTNPYPGFQSAPENLYQLAEGGPTVAAPPEGYVSGQDAEFVYGFQPMPTDMPVVQETARASRGIASVQDPVAQKITVAVNNSGGDGDDYRAPNPNNTYNFNQTPSQSVSTPARDFASEQQDRAAAAAAAASAPGAPMYDFNRGGQVDMHNNGFVVDAHTVSELGNGSSNAGMEQLAQIGGRPIMGPGDGTSDSIPANIDGIQPAMVARDEVYMPPNAVKAYGGGSLKMGEKKLYKLMEQAHASRKKNGRGQSTGLKQLVS